MRRKTVCYDTAQIWGCFACRPDGTALGQSKNALALAARHHDATGHPTWYEAVKHVLYGRRAEEGVRG